jgi:hypothetical protein
MKIQVPTAVFCNSVHSLSQSHPTSDTIVSWYEMILEEFWIYRIYCTVPYSSWQQFTVHCYTHTHTGVNCLVFTSRCLVAASNGGSSLSSGFTNYSRPQLPASGSNSSQRLNPSKSISKLIWDRWSVGQCILMLRTHPRRKTNTFITVKTVSGLFDVRTGLSFTVAAGLRQRSHLPLLNSSGHFASWVLVHFLWWPLLSLLMTRPHLVLLWYA